MLRHDRIVTPEIAQALHRLEATDDLPLCCARSTLRGVRMTWIRWHAIVLRVVAARLDSIWVVSPWDAPLRFDSQHEPGFVVASPNPEHIAVNVYGHSGQWNSEAQAALVAVGNELSNRIASASEMRQPVLDVARESVHRGIYSTHNMQPSMLLDVEITRAAQAARPAPARGRPRTRTLTD